MATPSTTTVARIAGIIYRHHPENLSEAAGVARLIITDLESNGADAYERLRLFRALRQQGAAQIDLGYRGRPISIDHDDDGVLVRVGGSALESTSTKTRAALDLMRDIDMLISIGTDDELASISGLPQ